MATFCRLVAGAAVCFVVGVLLVGCTGPAPAPVRLAAGLTQVAADYDLAHQALERRIASLPEPDAAQWRAFIRDADAYKAALESMWVDAAVSPAAMEALYEAGVELYVRAHRLIAPDLKNMPLNDQVLLRQMDVALRRSAEAYDAWLTSPQNAQRAEILATGVELVKLALQLGVAIL